MKGQLILRFQVPNQGLVTNVPPHLVGPEALIDGQNVFVDLDGTMKCRRGLAQVGSTLSPAERVMGLGFYEDNNGIFYPMAGTPTRWQAQKAGVWTDISGGSFLSGTTDDPVRFTQFASGGVNYVIGCNNNNVLYQWNSAVLNYSAIPASPICKDVLILANRVVGFNTVEGGTRYPFRVRWSSINDQTTWGALNYADLIDSGCSIVGAALTSRISAVIYRQFAAWFIQAVPGGDANAFAFDRIPAGDHMTGPVSPASIVIAEGQHFYFGIDGRVYNFNGTSVQPISDPIDPVLRSLYQQSAPSRYSSTYVPAYRQLVFFFAGGSDSDPQHAIVYDLRRQAFEPIWFFATPITASNEIRTAGSNINWNTWVGPSVTWPTVPWATWASIPSPGSALQTFVGDPNGVISYFGVASNDNGSSIPYFATWGLQRSQDELSNSLIHYVEFYIPQTPSDDQVVATLLGYVQPLSTGNYVQSITSMTLVTTDQSTFYQTLPPGPTNPANVKSNLIQLVLNAQMSSGQFAFDGCTVLIDGDFRPDPRQGLLG